MNELKKIRKQQRAEDKKVAEKMMAVSTKKPANKGLTKAERKAAEEYDAKSNNTTGEPAYAALLRPAAAGYACAVVVFRFDCAKLWQRVAFAPRETKIAYLQQKCKLTAAELDAAFVAAYDAVSRASCCHAFRRLGTNDSSFVARRRERQRRKGRRPRPTVQKR